MSRLLFIVKGRSVFMKHVALFSVFIFFLCLFSPIQNDHIYAWVEGKELASVPLAPEHVEIMQDLGIDIEQIRQGVIRIWATQDELDILASLGISYTILHEEVEAEKAFFKKWKDRLKDPDRIPGTRADYHSYSDMVTALQNLETTYPAICKVVDLGNTVNGRDILAVVISDNVNTEENEPEVRLDGGIHGDEGSGIEVPIDIAKHLCQNYSPGSGNDSTYIVENLETWIIPMRNADGHESGSRYNAHGVDLNRNHDGPTGCTGGNPGCFSEPETQVIRDMALVMGKRFCLGISYHSGAECFNSLWNYDCLPPPDEDIFWLNRTTCNNNSGAFNETPSPNGLADAYNTPDLPGGFGWTNGAEWYTVRGDTTDYTYMDWGMLDTTIECTNTKTPSSTQIPTFLAWHRQPSLNYLKKAMQGIHGMVTDAGTGAPLDATIDILQIGKPMLNDPDVGDYHYVLMPGTYTVEASAAGYVTQTITGVSVTADTATWLDIQLETAPADLVFESYVIDDTVGGDGNGIADPDESVVLQITLRNQGGAPASGISALLSETSPYITITDNMADFPDLDALQSGESLSPHFAFDVDAGAPVGTIINFSLQITADDSYSSSDAFTLPVGTNPVLVVDDDEGDNYQTYYATALDNIGYTYDMWTVQTSGSPSASDLEGYLVVVWLTGDDYSTTLTTGDQSALQSYLDAGGSLFISGQDIGYDIRTSAFYGNYLRASYIADDSNDTTLTGITGDPVSEGVSLTIAGGDGASNQNYPELISAVSGSTALWYYNGSDVGAVRYDGTYKLCYLGFGFEAINNQTDRNTVMDNILSWFLGAANQDPALNNPLVTPDSGYYGTRFEYYIDYSDADGDAASLIQVNIDGTDYGMTLDSGTADNGTYRYFTRDMDVDAAHTYYFHAEDGNGGTARNPAAGTLSGPTVNDPLLVVSGTPEPGEYMTLEVWGAADALWAAAWSSQSGPHYVPVTGLFWDLGPGDLHMAKKIIAEPVHLDAYGYGSYDFRLPNNTTAGTKYIQAGTKMNAFWGQTAQESFEVVVP